MILTGSEIQKRHTNGQIRIEPFSSDRLTTNTYDLALGGKLLKYTEDVLDPKKENAFKVFEIPEEGYQMKAGEFLLAETVEKIGSNHLVPIIHAKSGTARMGLFVHVTADLFDIGYYGKSTLQLYATLPVRIYPGMLIAQVSFWVPKGEIDLYSGKYQGGEGPQASKSHQG
jgi:dCTP deaminase